ncbi:MAG: class I SAM-dependent methyltransferase [Alphaproteobacteria bacterium]|nr:class I SAM-dependent methyltransferase [Alphaproteobacteria bacterium]
MAFDGHYYDWRVRRIAAIVDHYGASFFKGSRVLELGAGFGDIGIFFRCLGADVTFGDARQEHLDEMRDRYPSLPEDRLVLYNAEERWPFDGAYDLILNLGMIYHCDFWERSIIESSRVGTHFAIETEVADSDDEKYVLKVEEEGYDQAFSGVGSRPSPAAMEYVMRNCGMVFQRVSDDRCNSGFHVYDWPPTNSGEATDGQRAFWFAEKMT